MLKSFTRNVLGCSMAFALWLSSATAADTILKGVNIVDIANNRILPEQMAIIRDDRIIYTGVERPVEQPAEELEASGKYVIPGLWDFHVHVFTSPNEVDFALPAYVVNGVTGIRDVGGFQPTEVIRQVAADVKHGKRIGPRIVLAGAVIDGPPGAWPGIKVAATPEEGRSLVRAFKAEGWSFIKTYSLVRPDVYDAIADEAHKLGLGLFGHVPEAVSLAQAVSKGHGIVEHFGRLTMACSTNEPAIVSRRLSGMAGAKTLADIMVVLRETHPLALKDHDEKLCSEAFERLKINGTWVMPSLIVADFYMGRDPAENDPRMQSIPLSVRSKWKENDFRRGQQTENEKLSAVEGVKIEYGVFKKAHKAGVKFLAGTDAGYINPYIFHGFSIHDELERYVENGMTPAEALATATVNPSAYLGETKEAGRIAAGMRADIVVLDTNPLMDIKATRQIQAVIVNGKVYDRKDLDRLRTDLVTRAAQQ